MILEFLPFPEIYTKRLHLRRLTSDDAAGILALRSNPVLMQYIPRPLLQNLDEARAHIQLIDDRIKANEGINWGITLRESSDVIGIIGHYTIKTESRRAEIGYMLLEDFARKGLMSEAVKAVVDYGFDVMQLHSIEAIIAPDNLASEKVLQKNGFVKEAHLLENEFYNGQFLDTVIYSLLKKNRI
ncbi:GNAT family N-acetyltransferase [Flavobacterium branchiophilum]|uniref:Probable ribosomal-protein-amino-adic N-acetyltransferase n=1 Tax=Flavobacterium branchiophilum (strain FL-15) TaxID=1034807 RepID=G2Z0K7_FLABF|nr:Probable ribosomal-protein-amino-adic N-acetyltransferase [Flavobacterium branchiophilum FL-15]